MPTKAQVNANRQNAQKSTGPKTPEGKAAVSKNSTKHGLLSHKDVISSESQEEFDLHRDQFLEELAPATPMESFLADRIVSLTWRLKRSEIIQNQAIDALDERNNNSPFAKLTKSMLSKLHPVPQDDNEEPPLDIPLGRLAVKDCANYRVLDRLLMYERRIENSLHKTMLELQRQKLINNINTEHQSPADSSPGMNPELACRELVERVEGPVNQQMKNMQNKPNLKNPQINVTSAKTKNYENILTFGGSQNEPKTNPILPSNLSNEDWASLKAFAKEEKKTQFMKKQTQTIVA